MGSTALPPSGRPTVGLLVVVWGERYIRQFLELGLRTLLAPGNVPALAADCACTFRILTAAENQGDFTGHPVFQRLSAICRTEFVAIDDLISPGTHSTTVTLAYERGMRRSGTAMTDTYFVYLVADYIMADGSLATLIRHMRDGVSGITSGNFQVVEETAEGPIRRLLPPGSEP